MYQYRLTMLLFFGMAILFTAGCDNKIKSQGTIRFSDGQPLTYGFVSLSNDQYEFIGEIQSDGTFRMTSLKPGDGLPPGKYNVAVKGTSDGDGTPTIDETSLMDKTIEVSPSNNTFELVVERATDKQIKEAKEQQRQQKDF